MVAESTDILAPMSQFHVEGDDLLRPDVVLLRTDLDIPGVPDLGTLEDVARGNGVDADPMLAQLEGPAAGHVQLAGLGRVVGSVVLAGVEARFGAEIDDAAAHALGDHDPGGRAGRQEIAGQIDFQGQPPVVGRHVDQGVRRGDPGSVDEDVQAAPVRQERIESLLHALFARDIAADDLGLLLRPFAGDNVRRLLGGLFVDVRQGDQGPGPRQTEGDAPAQAAAGPGDDRDPVAQLALAFAADHLLAEGLRFPVVDELLLALVQAEDAAEAVGMHADRDGTNRHLGGQGGERFVRRDEQAQVFRDERIGSLPGPGHAGLDRAGDPDRVCLLDP